MSTTIYYIRHKHDWNNYGIEKLIEDQRVGIHFSGNKSLSETDYSSWTKGERSAVGYLNDLNGSGSSQKIYLFICYTYSVNNKQKTRIILGEPIANSFKAFESRPGIFIKTVAYKTIKEITEQEFPYVYLLAPRQSTFVQWHACRTIALNYISSIERGETLKLDGNDPDEYLPSSLEILCEEYLREKGLLEKKLLKTGGSLKEFDIFGLDIANNMVLGQVKNRHTSSEVKKFKDIVQKYSNAKGYFFSASPKPKTVPENIEWVNINEIIKFFNADPKYVTFIEKLVNLTW